MSTSRLLVARCTCILLTKGSPVEHVDAVRRIVRLNRAGLELRRLRHLVDCQFGENGMRTTLCEPLRSVLTSKRAELARQIRDLQESHRMLSTLLATRDDGKRHLRS